MVFGGSSAEHIDKPTGEKNERSSKDSGVGAKKKHARDCSGKEKKTESVY